MFNVFRALQTAVGEVVQVLVWQTLVATNLAFTSKLQPQRPPDESDFVKPIPAGRRYPGLVDAPLIFSELTPPSERFGPPSERFGVGLFLATGVKFTWWLKELYAQGNTLVGPYTRDRVPYPWLWSLFQPPPVLPEDFKPGADPLAGVARRGPFSVQTQKDPKGGPDDFIIDLTALQDLVMRAPFIATGGLARFKRTGPGAPLETVGVEFQGKLIRPGEPDWAITSKRFLVGLNSQTTFIEHLVNLHISTAGAWGIVARMTLSTRHPLRMLLQPFTQETNRVNNYFIDGLILTENSNVPLYGGYSLEHVNNLLRSAAGSFDVRIIDPERRAKNQGTINDATFPTVQSAVEIFTIFHNFTKKWCDLYLHDGIDLETRSFCEELNDRVPGGIQERLIPTLENLTKEDVAYILAVGAFGASVGHHIVNDLTRNYMMSFHVMPTAIDANGVTPTGLVLEKRESITFAGVQRYKLISDIHAPDASGYQLWTAFQLELALYEDRIQSEPPDISPYRIYPSRISSSIHA